MVLLTPKFFRWLTSFIVILLLPMAWDSSAFVLHNFGLALTFLGGGIWLLQRIQHPRKIRLPWLFVPMAVYILYQFALVSIAPLPVYSLRALFTKLAILLLFVFFIDSFEWGWDETTWMNAFFAVVALTVILELGLAMLWLLQWVSLSNTIFTLPPIRYTAPGMLLSNANSLSAFLNLAIPFVIAKLLCEKSSLRCYLWAIFLLLIFVVSYLSASRSGWLSLVAGLAAMFGILWWYRRQKTAQEVLWPLVFLLLGLGLAIQQLFFNGKAPLSSARGDIWQSAWTLFLQSPIWGHGAKSFGLLYAPLNGLPPGFTAQHGHNIILQILVESGIIGAGIALAGLWIMWRNLRQNAFFQSSDKNIQIQKSAFIGAMVVFGVHHLGDFILWNPLYTASGLLLLVILLKQNHRQYFSLSSGAGNWFLGVILIIFLSANLWAARGDFHYWQGLNSATNEDWSSAQKEICVAANNFPQKTHFAFECGLVSAQLDDMDALKSSIELQKQALEIDPYWAVHQANYAAMLWQIGEHDAAQVEMALAVGRAPDNAIFALNLGWMAEERGDIPYAQDWYSRALKLNPNYAQDWFFTRNTLRQNVATTEKIPSNALTEGWRLLEAHDFPDAKNAFDTALETSPHNASIWAGLALAEQALNLSQAELSLKKAQFISPTAWQVTFVSAEFAQNTGDQSHTADILFRYFERQKNIQEKSKMYYSAPYYFGAYHQPMLSFDFSPQLIRPLLPVPMAHSFQWLAEYYKQSGDNMRANSIENWLKNVYP